MPLTIRFVVGLLVAAAPGPGSPTDEPSPSEDLPAEELDQFAAEFKRLGDWSQQGPLVRDAIENVWAHNGWTSEADEFAKSAVLRVAEIPPWDVQGRLEVLTEAVSQRYEFTDVQSRKFKSLVMQEATWFVVKHSPTLLAQTRAAISDRIEGRPFTPEQISRWTRESEELFQDAHDRIGRVAGALERTMDERQKQILRVDRESLERRKLRFDEKRRAWSEGKWRPEDWGLQNDPIQQPGARPHAPDRGGRSAAPPTRVLPFDETTWDGYARSFILRYSLDATQRETVLSIQREVVERARHYRRGRERALAAVRLPDRWVDPLHAPIRVLFYEMTSRLERIPTSSQRKGVERNALLNNR